MIGLFWLAAVAAAIAILLAPAGILWLSGIYVDFFSLTVVTMLWLLVIAVALFVLVREELQ